MDSRIFLPFPSPTGHPLASRWRRIPGFFFPFRRHPAIRQPGAGDGNKEFFLFPSPIRKKAKETKLILVSFARNTINACNTCDAFNDYSKLSGSTVILIGVSFQMSFTYSWMVLSEENFPEDAMFRIALFAQAAWS